MSDLHETVRYLRKTVSHQEHLLEQLMASIEQCESKFPAWLPPGDIAESGAMQVPKLRIIRLDLGAPSVFGRIKSTWVYRFYVNHLKLIPPVRWFVICFWRNLYPVYTSTISVYLGARAAKRWRPLVRLQDYVARSHITTTKVFDAVRVETPMPKIFPNEDQAYLESPHDHYVFPPVYIAELGNGLVYGGTNLVFSQDAVICHDLYDFERDYTSEELHGRHVIDAKKLRMRLLRHDAMPETVAEAAAFVDACAPNYAHWLTEVLPRIAAFCTVGKFANVPIIINHGLHPNIMESLARIVGPDREIITLPIGRAVQVDRLCVTSVAGYVPFERRNAKLANHSHGMFCPPALQLIRNRCFSYIDDLPLQEWPDKVYLRRTSGARQIVNIIEIEQALQKNGYVAVEPEKLSFVQQVILLSNARDVISPTGAAVSNAIFMQLGATCLVLMGRHEIMNYRYWLNMLTPLGVDINYILGVATVGVDASVHSDFHINLKNMSEYFIQRNAHQTPLVCQQP